MKSGPVPSRTSPWFIALSETGVIWTPNDLRLTGWSSYFDVVPGAPTWDPRIHLQVELGNQGLEVFAMLDTAAPWFILDAAHGSILVDELEELPDRAVISSRLGRFSGKLYRGQTTLVAEEGTDLAVDTTFFLAPDWPGGNFVGYQGFLDRFLFAVAPDRNRFYFGTLM